MNKTDYDALALFQELAARTCPHIEMIPKGSENILLLDKLHMVLGIQTELEEFYQAGQKDDLVNMGEELADMLWYVVNYLRIQGLILKSDSGEKQFVTHYQSLLGAMPMNIERRVSEQRYLILRGISAHINILADALKKNLAYNRPLNRISEGMELITLYYYIRKLANSYKIDLNLYLERVIAKLLIRFPKKFDQNQALEENRDLAKEREILEGKNDLEQK